jgi:hypothetical protein
VNFERQTEPKDVIPHPDILVQEEHELFELEEAELDVMLQR